MFNNTLVVWEDIIKPCKLCGYCPYGQLAEDFPLRDSKESCQLHGHDCPVYYVAMPFMEEGIQITEEEYEKHNKELIRRAKNG